MGSAVCAASGLAAAALVVLGTGERGTDAALQLTARLAFLFFWPAYAAGALAALFGGKFLVLKAHARDFGLAFASAMLVHAGLIGWLCGIGHAPGRNTFVFFGVALGCTYLIALASIARLQRMLGPKTWRLVRLIGLNYIALAFAVDFFGKPLFTDTKQIVGYLPFAVLTAAGPLLRLAALAQGLRPGRAALPAASTGQTLGA
jgi:hypothetical protein